MNTPRSALSAFGLSLLVAAAYACSADGAAPPPSPASGNAPPALYASGASAPPDTGDAGADAPTTSLPTDPPLCGTDAWSSGTKARELTASDMQSLAGITPLGRTFAWVDTNGRLLVADRKDATSEFDDAVTVDDASPTARAALHPAGAMLVATNASRTGLVAYERLYRKDPWAGPSTLGVDALNAQLGSLGATISEMTIGGEQGSLFLLLAIGASHVLYEAASDPATKGFGRAVPHDETAVASTSTVRRPTGLSWDGRTLFFFDEGASVARAAFRATSTGPFTTVADVGAFPGAIPAQSCTRLYYVDHDKDGAGLFSVSR